MGRGDLALRVEVFPKLCLQWHPESTHGPLQLDGYWPNTTPGLAGTGCRSVPLNPLSVDFELSYSYKLILLQPFYIYLVNVRSLHLTNSGNFVTFRHAYILNSCALYTLDISQITRDFTWVTIKIFIFNLTFV